MSLRKVILFFTLLFLIILSSCSKTDENNPVAPKNNEPAKLELKEITVPSHLTQVQDQYAQMAAGYIQMINSLTNYAAFFTPPKGAKHITKANGIQDEWTWTENSLTVTLDYSEGESSISWKVILTGLYEGFNVTNWTFMEAEQSKDGNSGHLTIYEPVTTNVAINWEWSKNASGNASFIYTDFKSSMKLQIDVDKDNSGVLQILKGAEGQFVLEYKINWTATGSGEWWEYDATGNITNHGTWT